MDEAFLMIEHRKLNSNLFTSELTRIPAALQAEVAYPAVLDNEIPGDISVRVLWRRRPAR